MIDVVWASFSRFSIAWVPTLPVYQAKSKVEPKRRFISLWSVLVQLIVYMFCCFAKISYYFLLIIYHGCDIVVDWFNFSSAYNNGTFAGVPANISVDFASVSLSLFGLSCHVGTFCSIAMIVVYCYYIKFHWNCIDKKCEFSKHRCYKECNRCFISAELVISIFELFLKDDIQSGLLFYMPGSILLRPSWHSMALWMSVCSIVALLKLLICFFTKHNGYGEGEKKHGSTAKGLAVIGLVGSSVVCLILTIGILKN